MASDPRIVSYLGDYTHGLDKIEQLQPVWFKFKGNDIPPPRGLPTEEEAAQFRKYSIRFRSEPPYAEAGHFRAALNGTRYVSLKADQYEKVVPECACCLEMMVGKERITDMVHEDPQMLIFTLINAVKELSARVKALEQDNARLSK